MPEENIDQEQLDRDDEIADELDIPDELPTDPVELRAVAERMRSGLIGQVQVAGELKRSNKILTQTVEEERENKKANWNLAEQRGREIETLRGGNGHESGARQNGAGTKDDVFTDVDTGDERDFGHLTAERVPVKRFLRQAVAEILNEGDVIDRKVERHLADRDKVQDDMASTFAEMRGRFPDLKDPGSALTKAAVDKLIELETSRPDLKPADRQRLAVLDAATSVKLTDSKGNGNGKDKQADVDRKQRENATKGVNTRSGRSGLGVEVTDADRKSARNQNGGQAVADADILAYKARQARFLQDREASKARV